MPNSMTVQTNNPQDSTEKYSTPTIGIIYPPPELRNIVDKTAHFVARNGSELEGRIRQHEAGNPKFDFLKPQNPYHAYYMHKVNDFASKPDAEPQIVTPQVSTVNEVPTLQEKLKRDIQDRQLADAAVGPPPAYDFSHDPSTLSSHDLDIVRLTALCAARSGRQFVVELMQREARNYQFDFLKQQHPMFDYFTSLIEQYTKVLLPTSADLQTLRQDVEKPFDVLDRVRQRAVWYMRQKTLREHEEEELERERQQYLSIDWRDFTIVEKIDFQAWEEGEFPPPTRPEEVGMRTVLYERMLKEQAVQQQQSQPEHQHRTAATTAKKPLPPNTTMLVGLEETGGEAEMDIEDESETASDAAAAAATAAAAADSALMPPPFSLSSSGGAGQRVVRRNYDPRQVRQQARSKAAAGGGSSDSQSASAAEYVISPITGERIPVEKMAEHLKMGLLDPQYLEQRDRQIERRQLQEDVFAPGSAIGSSLKMMAERRDDIFLAGRDGAGDSATSTSTSSSRAAVSWDGFAGSTRTAEQMAASLMDPAERRRVEREIAIATGLIDDPTLEKIGPQIHADEQQQQQQQIKKARLN